MSCPPVVPAHLSQVGIKSRQQKGLSLYKDSTEIEKLKFGFRKAL